MKEAEKPKNETPIIEQIYDEKVSPLIHEILEICKEYNFSFFSESQYNRDGFCRAVFKSENFHTIFKVLEAASQCIEGEQFHIDRFLIWAIKNYDVSMSVYLKEWNIKK